MNSATSRRRFLASSAAAGSLLLTTPRAPASLRSANDRVRIAVLGLNGRGKAHLSGFMGLDNVEIAAVVDPDSEVLGRTVEKLQKKAGKAATTPVGLADFRRVLDDKSIDAVSIAAPNHWHSLMPDADPPATPLEGSGGDRPLPREPGALQLALVLEDRQRRPQQPGNAPARRGLLGDRRRPGSLWPSAAASPGTTRERRPTPCSRWRSMPTDRRCCSTCAT